MYADTKKSISNLIGMVRATVWNYDAEKRLRHMIRDTKPDAVYILHEVIIFHLLLFERQERKAFALYIRISRFFYVLSKI